MKTTLAVLVLGVLSLGIACGGSAGPSLDRQRGTAHSTVLDGTYSMQEYAVPTYPHDVAPAPDGTVWFTCQRSGQLGNLDPATGDVRLITLQTDADLSAPHGVIIGPDGAPWITDGGRHQAILRVDPITEKVSVYPLPPGPNANLNTLTFDRQGNVWFTGQSGIYGKVDLKAQPPTVDVFPAPRGAGPYGISTTSTGEVYYASLAGSYVGHINTDTAEVEVLDPPTPRQGARRVWPDSRNRIWVSEWNVGKIALYDPDSKTWREWSLAGQNTIYAVFVDELDQPWVSDWTSGDQAFVRFNEASETFDRFPFLSNPANVRQIGGRAGEIWGAESGTNKLVVLRRQP